MADPQKKYDDEGSSYGVPLATAGAGIGAAGTAARYIRKSMAVGKYDKNQTIKKRKAKLAEYEAEQAKAQKAYDDIKKEKQAAKAKRKSGKLTKAQEKAFESKSAAAFKRLNTTKTQITKAKARVKELDPNTNFADTKTKTSKSGSPTWGEAISKSNLEISGLEANFAEAKTKADILTETHNNTPKGEGRKTTKAEYNVAKAEFDDIKSKLDAATETLNKNKAGFDKHGDVPTDGSTQAAADDTVRAKDQTKYDTKQAKAKAKADKKAELNEYLREKNDMRGKKSNLKRQAVKAPIKSLMALGATGLANKYFANEISDASDGMYEDADLMQEAAASGAMGDETTMSYPMVANGLGGILDLASYAPGIGTGISAAGVGGYYGANALKSIYDNNPNAVYTDEFGNDITPDKMGYKDSIKQGFKDSKQAIYDNTIGKLNLASAKIQGAVPFMGDSGNKRYDDIKKELKKRKAPRFTDPNKTFYEQQNRIEDMKSGTSSKSEVELSGRQHYINDAIQTRLDDIKKKRKIATTNLENADLELDSAKKRLDQQTDLKARSVAEAEVAKIEAEIERNNTVLRDMQKPESKLINDRNLLSTSLDTDLLDKDNVLTNTYVEGDKKFRKKFRSFEMGQATVSGAVSDFMSGVTEKLGQAAAATGAAATAAADKTKEVVGDVADDPKGYFEKKKAWLKDKVGFSKNVAPDGTPDTPEVKKPGRLRTAGKAAGRASLVRPIYDALKYGTDLAMGSPEERAQKLYDTGQDAQTGMSDMYDAAINRTSDYMSAVGDGNYDLAMEMGKNDITDAAGDAWDYGVEGGYKVINNGYRGIANLFRDDDNQFQMYDIDSPHMVYEGENDLATKYDEQDRIQSEEDRNRENTLIDKKYFGEPSEDEKDEADLVKEVALANSIPGRGAIGSAVSNTQPKVDPMDKYNSSSMGTYGKTPVYKSDPMSRENRNQYGSGIFSDTRSGATPEYFNDRNQPDQVKRRQELQAVEDAKYSYLPPSLRALGAEFERLPMETQSDIIDKYSTRIRNDTEAKQDAAKDAYDRTSNYAGTRSGLEGQAQTDYTNDMQSINPLAAQNATRTALDQARDEGVWGYIKDAVGMDNSMDNVQRAEILYENNLTPVDSTSARVNTGYDTEGKAESQDYVLPDRYMVDLMGRNK